jgi:L-2,4-diaminobutyrate decarboxylase
MGEPDPELRADPLRTAFDPDSFRDFGHRVVDLLADRLRSSLAGEGAVLLNASPAEEFAYWNAMMDEAGGDEFEFLDRFVARSIQLHHPGYVGHQVCAPAPGAAVAGFVAELLNNGMAVYEMGPAATALERWVVEQTGRLIGFSEPSGFLTSGGTLAMLTGLLAARSRFLSQSAGGDDVAGRFAVLASAEAHYCASRAAQVMGWGEGGIVRVPVDHLYKMRVDLLEDALEHSLSSGRLPVAVVGSACSTSTGSYDNLHAIADFCEKHALWFHVDGAHGGGVAFCEELRHRLAGAERADSIMIDFHKMLLTPALATALIFRDSSRSWAAFHPKAEYLWNAEAKEEWFNVGRRSFECTKLSMSLKIASVWRRHGVALFAENVRRTHANALAFWRMLQQDPRFEVAVQPESNIVCFRLSVQENEGKNRDELHKEVRAHVLGDGSFYLVQTVLGEQVWLRTALMNPFTSEIQLRALMKAIVRAAAELQAG